MDLKLVFVSFRRQRYAVKAAIQAPGPSFRDMQPCAGGGKHQVRPSGTCSFALAEATFLGDRQEALDLGFVTF